MQTAHCTLHAVRSTLDDSSRIASSKTAVLQRFVGGIPDSKAKGPSNFRFEGVLGIPGFFCRVYGTD
jgi:hypothetical protein